MLAIPLGFTICFDGCFTSYNVDVVSPEEFGGHTRQESIFVEGKIPTPNSTYQKSGLMDPVVPVTRPSPWSLRGVRTGRYPSTSSRAPGPAGAAPRASI